LVTEHKQTDQKANSKCKGSQSRFMSALRLTIKYEFFFFSLFAGPRLGCLFLLLMFYGWAIIPLMYLFSFVFRSASKAFVVLTIFNIVTGLVTLLTVFILSVPGKGCGCIMCSL